jgi:hypothetical protein
MKPLLFVGINSAIPRLAVDELRHGSTPSNGCSSDAGRAQGCWWSDFRPLHSALRKP